MKKFITTTAILMSLMSTSNAGNGITIERPCGSKCIAPQPIAPLPLTIGMTFRRTGEGNIGTPDYVGRSQTVIRSNYGTTVIRGTYRSYSR